MRGEIKKPVFVYDGGCGFCKLWVRRWQKMVGEAVEFAPFQTAAQNFPDIPRSEFEAAVKLIVPDGRVFSAAEATFRMLALGGQGRWLWLYEHVPGFKHLAEAIYRLIAKRRSLAFSATAFLFGTNLEPASYAISAWLFWKALGLIYLIAFSSFWVQGLGLIGERGILPVRNFISALRDTYGLHGIFKAPTLFWFGQGDWMVQVLGLAGIAASIIFLAGVAPRMMLVILFILYLSLVVGGQIFMSFQWDILLLETGFLAMFLSGSSRLSVLLLWWLLFRLTFLSGAVKLLSGDPTWRNLTALTFHYETQPLPTILGWYAHQLPAWFQKFSTAAMFFIELVVPFLFFAPRHLRFFAALTTVFLQLLIFLTGNYTFFNLLTIALVLLLFDDQLWRAVLPVDGAGWLAEHGAAIQLGAISSLIFPAAATLIIILSLLWLWQVFSSSPLPRPARKLLETAAPFHIVNSYGLFALMSTSRPEIIVEGSHDGQQWLAYEFKYKPGDFSRQPRWVQPHQPRLDWQMWFAALSNYQQNPWFTNFALRLLQGSPDVLKLLGTNPFPSQPPKYIRALRYDYHFTTLAERRATAAWWKRQPLGLYLPPASPER